MPKSGGRAVISLDVYWCGMAYHVCKTVEGLSEHLVVPAGVRTVSLNTGPAFEQACFTPSVSGIRSGLQNVPAQCSCRG